MRKKVLVCCTNAVATSTFVALKVKNKLQENGYEVEVKTCSVLEVNRVIKSYNPDIIISNVGKGAHIETDKRVIDGIPIISGMDDEEAWKEVFEEAAK